MAVTREEVMLECARLVCGYCADEDRWQPARKGTYPEWWHLSSTGGNVRNQCSAWAIHHKLESSKAREGQIMSHYSLLDLFHSLLDAQTKWATLHGGYPEHEHFGDRLKSLVDDIRDELFPGKPTGQAQEAPLTAEEALAGAAQIDKNLAELFPKVKK